MEGMLLQLLKAFFVSTETKFSNCILKCLWSRSWRSDIHGILNVIGYTLTTEFNAPLFTYSHHIFTSWCSVFWWAFLDNNKKKNHKSRFKVSNFPTSLSAPPILHANFHSDFVQIYFCAWEVTEFSEMYFRYSISIWKNISCFLPWNCSSQFHLRLQILLRSKQSSWTGWVSKQRERRLTILQV